MTYEDFRLVLSIAVIVIGVWTLIGDGIRIYRWVRRRWFDPVEGTPEP